MFFIRNMIHYFLVEQSQAQAYCLVYLGIYLHILQQQVQASLKQTQEDFLCRVRVVYQEFVPLPQYICDRIQQYFNN